MYYRTRTYIAGGWDENKEAIQQLYRWNDSERWALEFSDAHELTQARDSSLPCSIKESLRVRLGASKTFVLVVGGETNALRKGGCQYCEKYHSSLYGYQGYCANGHNPDTRSFIDYECEIAAKAYRSNEMKIVVLYDALTVDRVKCPEPLRWIGNHVPMRTRGFYGVCYDYQTVKNAIMY